MHINIAKINFKPISINIAKVDFGLYGVVNYQDEYLTLSALDDGEITITIPDMVDQTYATSISYSKDKSNWTETVVDNTEQTITIPVSNGDDVYLKAVAQAWCNDVEELFTHIYSSARINASGNIMSLLYGDDFKDKTTFPDELRYTFGELFNNNTHLINAKNLILPATTLTSYCYYNMFGGCTSLTQAPELPATTLAFGCYTNMFAGCSSLTTAPALPAITAVSSCYDYMFSGCTSLTTAPELPATTLNDSCYSGMFSGCTSLENAPELPATTLAEWCYHSMFLGCTSLTAAPELPATTLYENCYRSMFQGCTSLTHAPALSATALANYCYYNMFKNCTSLVQAPALPATSLLQGCYYEMFYGCTSLVQAPELPATNLIDNCYHQMFNGCTKLNYVKAMFTTTPSNNYTLNWLNNVSQTGTFVKNASATWNVTGANGIPKGWTVETASPDK